VREAVGVSHKEEGDTSGDSETDKDRLPEAVKKVEGERLGEVD